MAKALLEGEVDALIGIVDLEWWRRSNSMLGFRVSGLLEGSRHSVVMSIRNDWPLLPGILNKALATIPLTERHRINQRWLSAEMQGLQPLYLSGSEHAYLQSKRFRRIATGGYPPFSFIDRDGNLSGIAEDYWALIRTKLQLKVEELAPESFATVLNALERQEADLFVSTTATPDREAYALFSDSYEQFPIALATLRGQGFITDAASLEGQVVAVGESYSAYHLLRERYPAIIFLQVTNTAAALDAVVEGRAVAAADTLPVLQHLMAARGDDSLHLGGVTDAVYKLQIMVNKAHQPLLPLLNRAIATLTEQERITIQKRWMWRAVTTEKRVDYTLLGQILLGALLLIAAILVWNRRLSQQIRRRIEAERPLQEAAMLFQVSNNGVVLTDEKNTILRINPAFSEITGYSAEEVVGQTPSLLKSGHHPQAFYHQLWQMLLSQGYWEGEIWNRHKSGKIFPLWERIVVMRDKRGGVSGYLSQFSDIARRKLTEEEIRQRGNYDALTGLANRSLLLERLELAVKSHQQHGHKLALLMIGLDKFSQVNETMGYPSGDELLKQAALRLQAEIGELDTAARVGGDEFLLLLSERDDQIAVEESVRRLSTRLESVYTLPAGTTEVSASIGISLFPDDADSAEELLRNANLALARAKGVGGVHHYFTESMGQELRERYRLESDLRLAVAEGELGIHYQPIIDLASGRVCGVESLLRWQHKELGGISPGKFIPIAESSGLIQPLGSWVIESVCRQLQSWHAADLRLYAAVNVSPRQIPDGVSPSYLQQLMVAFGLTPDMLVLEITESTLAEDLDKVANWLREVRAQGFRVYLDDFGTGYSSLSYLKNFPVDAVKIDQSFVRDMVKDQRDYALVETIVALSKTLKLQVVAEGIETEGQRQRLCEMSCSYGQGYLFSRPQPPEQLDSWLHAH